MKIITDINDTAFASLLTEDAKRKAQAAIDEKTRRWQSVSPEAFLNGLCDRCVAYTQWADIDRVRMWDYCNNYYKGNHSGSWVDFGRGGKWWVVDDPYATQGVFRINLYASYIREVESLWTRSNTKIEWRARNDHPNTVGAAKTASMVDGTWLDHYWTPTLRQLESKHAQITGNYLRRFFWSGKSEQVAYRPKTEDIPITAEDEGYICNDCTMAGPLSSNHPEGTLQATGMQLGAAMIPLKPDGTCPSCGSGELSQFGLPPMTVSIVTGKEAYDPGDVMGEIIDPMEFSMHLESQTWQQSPFGSWFRVFDRRILEAYFPWADIPNTPVTDLRLIYQRMARYNVGNDYSWATDGGLQEMGQLEAYYIEPSMYSHYVTPKIISGDINLAPDTRMIEQYPEGCFLQRIGGHIVDGPWPCNKSEEIVHGRYDVVMQQVWGRGQIDAVSSNERYEEAGTLAFESLMHLANPREIVNQKKIDWRSLTGDPRLPGKMMNPATGDSPGSFIYQGRSDAGGSIAACAALMQNDMQIMDKLFSSYPGFRGASQRRARNATQTAIERDSATALHSSPIEIKEECDALSSTIRLKLYQKHWTGTRQYFTRGQYDAHEAFYFSRADIQGDLYATVRRGGGRPQGENEKRSIWLEAAGFGGVPLGVFNKAVFSQKERRVVLQNMGIYEELDDTAPDYRKQLWEINKLKQILPDALQTFEMAGTPGMFPAGMPDPMTGQPTEQPVVNEQIAMWLADQIPVKMIVPPGLMAQPGQMMPMSVSVDNDEVHLMKLDEWFKSDEGLEAHPLMIRALEIHYHRHLQAQVATAQFKQMLGMMATAPMRAMQDQQNQKNPPAGKRSRGPRKRGGPDAGKNTAQPSEANLPSGRELESRLPK